MLKHVSTLRNWVEPGTIWAGWIAWGVFALAAFVIGLSGKANSVTTNYRAASHAWLHTERMYFPGGDGWIYLPQSALLFAPMHALPERLGEGVWRCAWVMLMAWAVWRLTRVLNSVGGVAPALDDVGWLDRGRVRPDEREAMYAGIAPRVDLFFLVTLLTIPACFGSVQNGQTNMPLGAAIVLACVSALDRRWWWCVAWCVFGLMCKPVMIVPILLLTACWVRPLMGRMALGLLIFAALPLVNWNSAYALREYHAGVLKVFEAGAMREREFANLGGLLADLQLKIPDVAMTVLRVVAAGGVLVICWLSARRDGLTRGALVTLALSAAYLMVMNPRTEGNSYSVLGPALAAWAALWLMRPARRPGHTLIAWTLVVGCVLLGGAHLITGPVFARGNDLSLRPLVALVFGGLLIWRVLADDVIRMKSET